MILQRAATGRGARAAQATEHDQTPAHRPGDQAATQQATYATPDWRRRCLGPTLLLRLLCLMPAA